MSQYRRTRPLAGLLLLLACIVTQGLLPATAGAVATTTVDDFSTNASGQPPAGWDQFGTPAITAVVQRDTTNVPYLHFPGLGSGVTDKWLIRKSLTCDNPTYTTRIRFDDTIADSAGLIIAWGDPNNHIRVTPNVYWGMLGFNEFVNGAWRTRIESPHYSLPLFAGNWYWLQVVGSSAPNGSKQVSVRWSPDVNGQPSNWQTVLIVPNLVTLSGRLGVTTSGTNLPTADFQNLSVSGMCSGVDPTTHDVLSSPLKLPFSKESGTWALTSGYGNYDHWRSTGTLYGVDFVRNDPVSGKPSVSETWGANVLAPGSGMVTNVYACPGGGTGGVGLNILLDGGSAAGLNTYVQICHIDTQLTPGHVEQGAVLGTVHKPDTAHESNTHLHLAAFQAAAAGGGTQVPSDTLRIPVVFDPLDALSLAVNPTITALIGDGGEAEYYSCAQFSDLCALHSSLSEPGVTVSISSAGGRLVMPNSFGQIDFPAGLVPSATSFTFVPRSLPSAPLDTLTFGGLSFTLTATDSSGDTQIHQFNGPFRITARYTDAQVQAAGIRDPAQLGIYFYDTSRLRWVPLTILNIDRGLHTITAQVDHLTEFALLADPTLPLAEPRAVDDAYSTLQNVALVVVSPGVLANDTAASATQLSATLVAPPAHGALTLNSDGSFVFAPNTGFVGSDYFTYVAKGGSLDSNTATVIINVVNVGADQDPGRVDPSATPELDSLTLLGSGFVGMAAYALTRARSRR